MLYGDKLKRKNHLYSFFIKTIKPKPKSNQIKSNPYKKSFKRKESKESNRK